jgi:ATP-dependent Clp protease ATP-binding subunit ClpC
VGYEEGGQLTERVKRSPYSVVLLDEIEKAHPDVFNILLQVFEDGQLTDGLGNTVDFKNVILIMTSNIGAKYLVKEKKSLGFHSDSEDQINETVEKNVMAEVKKAFNPEFLNRLDETILFQSLTDADLIQIVELLVQQLNANLAQKSITISVTEEAKKWILDKTLVDRSYGARPLRRALQRYVEDPLSEALIAGQIMARPAFLEVYLEANQLFYRPITADRYGSSDESAADEKAAGILLFSA